MGLDGRRSPRRASAERKAKNSACAFARANRQSGYALTPPARQLAVRQALHGVSFRPVGWRTPDTSCVFVAAFQLLPSSSAAQSNQRRAAERRAGAMIGSFARRPTAPRRPREPGR